MMEGGSWRQKWTNNRRSENKKPPHGCWQPTVPSWEKDFCKIVGSLDWETLLQMKKYMHFYDNIINWNDSAGEESLRNAKKRYWAEINGLSCKIPLPDPDLYIQSINWDSEINPELLSDLDCMPVSPKHDPVVIFNDSFVANQGFSPTGWGDAEKNFEPVNNNYYANYGDSWGQNWNLGNSRDNNDAWQYGDGNGAGYMSWGGDWNNGWGWGWGYGDNNYGYVGPYDGNAGTADDGGQYVWRYGTSNDRCKNYNMSRFDKGCHKGSYHGKQAKRGGSRGWNSSMNSCGPVGQHARNRNGEMWNREKRVS